MPESVENLQTVSAMLQSVIGSEPGVEQPEALASKLIDLDNATCLSKIIVIYSTPGQTEPSKGDWERFTSLKELHRESEALGLKRISQIRAGWVGLISFCAKPEDVKKDNVPASSTLFYHVAEGAMSAALDEMKSFRMVYDVDHLNLLVAHEDVADDSLEERETRSDWPFVQFEKQTQYGQLFNDTFTLEHVIDLVELVRQVMTAGVHKHVSWWWMQFPEW